MSFLKSVFNNYRTIWAISPSSWFLYRKMIGPMELAWDVHIVEFGAGSGAFTDALLKKLTPGSFLSIFEIDPLFIRTLQTKYQHDKRVMVHSVGAEESDTFFGKESIDYIISSLPFGLMDESLVLRILASAKHVLKAHGKFIQFQYFLQNKKQIHETFPRVRYKFTLLNLPPAFVYICRK